jgi:hypothetical protein
MRNVIAGLLVAFSFLFSGAVRAQVNYELFPGYGDKRGYPPTVDYRAWVINYKDNKYYRCVASYTFGMPATPTLACTLIGSFNPPLMRGANVKTLQALGGPVDGTGEARAAFFWQIDQETGQIQFCIPIHGTNCAVFQIQ